MAKYNIIEKWEIKVLTNGLEWAVLVMEFLEILSRFAGYETSNGVKIFPDFALTDICLEEIGHEFR